MAKPSSKHKGHPALISIGKTIRQMRRDKKISQESLAYETDLDRSYVGGIERGEHNITIMNLLRISKRLGINLSELLLKAQL